MEILQGVIEAAKAERSPVILQISKVLVIMQSLFTS